MDNFAASYAKALKYSATHEGVGYLLSPESLTDVDRWGGPGADHTKRGVIADYLQDLGRDQEAAHLRGGHHVVVENGVVKRGRWTLRPLENLRDEIADAIYAAGGWDEAHPPFHVGTVYEARNTPHRFLPGVHFNDAGPDATPGDEAHDLLYEDEARQQPDRIQRDRQTGLPTVGGSCFTCHDFASPITEAPKEWASLLNNTVFDDRNHVVDHLDADTRLRLEKMVSDRSKQLRLEEAIPDDEAKMEASP